MQCDADGDRLNRSESEEIRYALSRPRLVSSVRMSARLGSAPFRSCRFSCSRVGRVGEWKDGSEVEVEAEVEVELMLEVWELRAGLRSDGLGWTRLRCIDLEVNVCARGVRRRAGCAKCSRRVVRPTRSASASSSGRPTSAASSPRSSTASTTRCAHPLTAHSPSPAPSPHPYTYSYFITVLTVNPTCSNVHSTRSQTARRLAMAEVDVERAEARLEVAERYPLIALALALGLASASASASDNAIRDET